MRFPLVSDPEAVARDPELAVLSAMAHGDDLASVEVAKALNVATPGLDEERTRLYLALVVDSLHEAAKAAFEALMHGKLRVPERVHSQVLRRRPDRR